jgi:hypothetical protein
MFCKFLAFLCFVHKNDKKTLYFLSPSMQCLIHLLINDSFHLRKSVASFWKSTTGTDLNRDKLLRGQFDYTGLGYKAMGWGEKFWVTHTLVNLISATTATEAHTLMRSTSWIHQRERALQDEQEFCVSGDADSLGRFVAISG